MLIIWASREFLHCTLVALHLSLLLKSTHSMGYLFVIDGRLKEVEDCDSKISVAVRTFKVGNGLKQREFKTDKFKVTEIRTFF